MGKKFSLSMWLSKIKIYNADWVFIVWRLISVVVLAAWLSKNSLIVEYEAEIAAFFALGSGLVMMVWMGFDVAGGK